MERGHALHLTYYTAARDETTERVVDPMRVLMVGGKGYLEAWCRRAEATRMFRVDRIDAFTELDEAAAPPAQAVPHDVSDGVFHPTPDLPLVTLRVGRGSRWITEYYPVEEVRRDDDEWLVTMRVTDLGWAQRLLLGLGPDVTVVGPPELVERIHAQATAALDQYAAPPRRSPARDARLTAVVMWIVIAAVVVGLVILVAVSLPVVGRLSGLQRARPAVAAPAGRGDEAAGARGDADPGPARPGATRRCPGGADRPDQGRSRQLVGKHAFPRRR